MQCHGQKLSNSRGMISVERLMESMYSTVEFAFLRRALVCYAYDRF